MRVTVLVLLVLLAVLRHLLLAASSHPPVARGPDVARASTRVAQPTSSMPMSVNMAASSISSADGSITSLLILVT